MGQRIGRRNGCECKGGSDRLLKLSRIPKGADQPVMRFNMRFRFFGSGGNGSSECFSCFGRLPGGKQIKRALVKLFGGGGIGFGHGCN